MPDVTFPDIDTSFAFPEPESNNFLQFHTSVDGRDVHTYYEEKAISNGVDISARLKALGLPLAPQREATDKALDALPRATQDELVKLGFAIPNEYDVGKAVEHHVVPSWTFKSTFYWDQTFPAGRQIVVEHRYKPSLGETVGTMLGEKDIDPAQLRDYETSYCVDKGFLDAANAALRKPDASEIAESPFYERRIAYVLKTAANWAGPIRDFRLTVDKGAADALVSFCADGVKKIGPTLFEVRHENFTPTQDLHILILYRPKT